jgi:hypothetical protein
MAWLFPPPLGSDKFFSLVNDGDYDRVPFFIQGTDNGQVFEGELLRFVAELLGLPFTKGNEVLVEWYFPLDDPVKGVQRQ